MTLEIKIRKANANDLNDLAELFDGYRQFYGQPADVAEARGFLEERLIRQDSVILIAIAGGAAVGFVQLYPSFSSVAMRRIFVLNDLFVLPEARNGGVATALIEKAEIVAAEAGAARMALATARENTAAQHLYEKMGWQRDEVFLHFNKPICS